MPIEIDLQAILLNTVTSLTSSVAAGSSISLPVVNTRDYSSNDYIIIGNLGDQNAELRQISSITNATAMVSSVLSFPHSSGEQVQKAIANRVELEKSANGTTFSNLATIDITAANRTVTYFDPTALATSYYRFRFVNTQTATNYPYSNIFQPQTPSTIDLILTDVASELGVDYSSEATAEMLFSYLAETDLDIANWVVRTNPTYYQQNTPFNLQVGVSEYQLAANVVGVTAVLVGYNTSNQQAMAFNTSRSIQINPLNSSYGYTFSLRQLASTRTLSITISPTPTLAITSGLALEVTVMPTIITSTTDALWTPFPSMNYSLLKTGIKEKVFREVKDNQQRADRYAAEFNRKLTNLRVIVNNNSKTSGTEEYSQDYYYSLR